MQTMEAQRALKALGYDPGPIDGVMGPLTRKAVRAFQADQGLVVDGIIGPRTSMALYRKRPREAVVDVPKPRVRPPWVVEMERRKGLHERTHHKTLWDWLKSAGGSVNPMTTPWCGDAVETAILRVLPDEPIPNNPMASINWLKFGVPLAHPTTGAILVFWRGSPTGWQGHVGFYVGEDMSHYHVLGGNQSNAITVTRIAKNRLRKGGIRWPSTYPLPTTGRVMGDGSGLVVTTNEA